MITLWFLLCFSLDISHLCIFHSSSLDHSLYFTVAKHFHSALSHSSHASLHNSATLAGVECTHRTAFIMLKCWISLQRAFILAWSYEKHGRQRAWLSAKYRKAAQKQKGRSSKTQDGTTGASRRGCRAEGEGKRGEGEGGMKQERGKTERGKVEEQETRPKMLGKAFLFWDKCTMFRAQHYTEQCPICYSAATWFSCFLT